MCRCPTLIAFERLLKYLIFTRDKTQDIRDETPNVLFDILNKESPFNKWVSLDVQALHLRNEVFSKHPPSLASEVEVKEFLLSLPFLRMLTGGGSFIYKIKTYYNITTHYNMKTHKPFIVLVRSRVIKDFQL
jgi:hypothetical protein